MSTPSPPQQGVSKGWPPTNGVQGVAIGVPLVMCGKLVNLNKIIIVKKVVHKGWPPY